MFLSTITGSFSTPAGENPTVAMVEAAYRQLGLDARYLNCEVAPAVLGDAVRGAAAMGWAGFNCSIPHKIAVIDHLSELAESAGIIGAVNCVVRRDGRWVGENTDGQGFLTSLRGCVDPLGAHVVVLGAGGAARAIAIETALAGAAAITVVNRDRARGAALAELIATTTPATAADVPWTGPYRIPGEADILVNATSIGLHPNGGALPDLDLSTLRPALTVADVIPNPPVTALLRAATAAGCTTLDGLGMLVEQARIGIRHWTGRTPDAGVMRATLAELFTAQP
jgi:shikimate dehydrogenase